MIAVLSPRARLRLVAAAATSAALSTVLLIPDRASACGRHERSALLTETFREPEYPDDLVTPKGYSVPQKPRTRSLLRDYMIASGPTVLVETVTVGITWGIGVVV